MTDKNKPIIYVISGRGNSKPWQTRAAIIKLLKIKGVK